MIHIYESRTAPENRRFIAQFERLRDNLYLTVHGPTAEVAETKAKLMIEYQALPPLERKAFDLKGRLAALGEEDEFGDML